MGQCNPPAHRRDYLSRKMQASHRRDFLKGVMKTAHRCYFRYRAIKQLIDVTFLKGALQRAHRRDCPNVEMQPAH